MQAGGKAGGMARSKKRHTEQYKSHSTGDKAGPMTKERR